MERPYLSPGEVTPLQVECKVRDQRDLPRSGCLGSVWTHGDLPNTCKQGALPSK